MDLNKKRYNKKDKSVIDHFILNFLLPNVYNAFVFRY